MARLPEIARLDSSAPGFEAALARLTAFDAKQDAEIDAAVAAIVADVCERGDPALLEYTERFDRLRAKSVAAAEREALELAARRILAFHERQRAESWSLTEPDGTLIGQRVTPLARVGVY